MKKESHHCSPEPPATVPADADFNIVLAGHANVGKSVLFHALTGRYAVVSNFPGTTVEMTYAETKIAGERCVVMDTPGILALPPATEDENVTRGALFNFRPRAVIQVADAKDLARALHLTLELAEYQIPMVLALNMADEARERGIVIDCAQLSRILGIPVVLTVGITGEGITELKSKIREAKVPRIRPRYDAGVENQINEIASRLEPAAGNFSKAAAVSFLFGDKKIFPFLGGKLAASEIESIFERAAEFKRGQARPFEMLRFEAKQAVIQEIAGEVCRKEKESGSAWLAQLGLWCLRPFPGYAIVFLILYLLYEFVGVFGAQTLVGWLEKDVFGKWLNPAISEFIRHIIPWTLVQDFIVGEYGLVTMAVTYALALIFPIVTTFFIFFGILEDSGYLPRLAVMLDRLFRLIGLNGKAVLPMVLGLGCGTMATVTTRILDTKKEKILVSLLLTLAVPCSAQLGVVFGMTAAVSVKVLLVWFAVICFSVMLVGWSASRILPGGRPPLLVSIPPMRIPQFSNVLKKVASRLHWYSLEVIPLFLVATAVLFVLDKTGLLSVLTNMFSPVVVNWLGLPAKTAEAFLIGFLRRDYGAAGLLKMSTEGLLSPRQVLVSMALVTLFMPCVAHMLVTYRERGRKITGIIFVIVITYALLVGGALNWFFTRFPVL